MNRECVWDNWIVVRLCMHVKMRVTTLRVVNVNIIISMIL